MLLLSYSFEAQETYKRKDFDYSKMNDSGIKCSNEFNEKLNDAIIAANNNNSKKSVEISEKLFNENKCIESYRTYGSCLFKNGQLIKGIDILEAGIEKYGANPELIMSKSSLLLELYEYGISQVNVDGNSIYLAKDKQLNYNEEEFKNENLNIALKDLLYLVNNYQNLNAEKFTIAKIYQIKKDYEKSNQYFETLLADKELADQANFNLAQNQIELKDYKRAEENLNGLLTKYPKEPQLLSKISELYKLNGETEKSKLFNKKRYFNQLVPRFCNIDFSEKNLEIVNFFNDEQKDYKSKLKKLQDIEKTENKEFVIDICIIILNIHSNHSNGLEEDAAKILNKIGKPSLEKVHKLFHSNISTCTVTNLASIMASIKDESSWQILVDYIPYIAKMPTTLIPPNVPKYLVKFDEQKGIKEILKVIKPMLSEETSDDAMAQLSFMNRYIYFEPLEKINFKTIELICKELGYSNSEIAQLKEKLK